MANEQTHWASMKTALLESTENAKKILLLRINSTSASTISHMDTHCPEIWFWCHINLQTQKLHKKNKNLVQLYSTLNGTRQVRKSNVKCWRFKSFLQKLFIRVSWTLNIYSQQRPTFTKLDKVQNAEGEELQHLVFGHNFHSKNLFSISHNAQIQSIYISHYTRLSSSRTIETNPNSLSGFVSLSLCVCLFSATEKKKTLHHNHDNFSMTRKHSLFLNKENKTL
jgi:hypothetical protein